MSDSAVLLQYMIENGSPDGSFNQNLKASAATIGWMPDRLSEAMQELVADGSVEATHEGGDPKKVAASSWRVVEMPAPAADGADEATADEADLDEKTVPQLKEFAEANGIELDGATRKDDVRAKIDAALQAAAAATDPPPADEPVDLSTLDVDALIAFAGENEIELSAGELEQADLVEYITEALAEKAASA